MKNVQPVSSARNLSLALRDYQEAAARFKDAKRQTKDETFAEMLRTHEEYTLDELSQMSGLPRRACYDWVASESGFYGRIKESRGYTKYRYARLDEEGQVVPGSEHTRGYRCIFASAR